MEKSPPTLFDENQKPIRFQLSTLPVKIEGWNQEEEMVQVPALQVDDWLKPFNPQSGDSILVTIKDWRKLEYRLAFEPAEQKKLTEVEKQNKMLADNLYKALCNHRDDLPDVSEVLPQVYVWLGEAGSAYPGDHWSTIIEQDHRMGMLGSNNIGLSRYASMDEESVLLQEADGEALNRVYLFKAHLRGRKGLWRRIEIRACRNEYPAG